MTAVVHNEQNPGLRRDSPLDIGGINIQRLFFDITENRMPTRHQNCVIGGDKGHRGSQHLATLSTTSQEGQVQGCGTGMERDGMFDAYIFGESLFKLLGLLAITQPTSRKRIPQSLVLGFSVPGLKYLYRIGHSFSPCGIYRESTWAGAQ